MSNGPATTLPPSFFALSAAASASGTRKSTAGPVDEGDAREIDTSKKVAAAGGKIVMDATGVEAITLNALAGDDSVTTVPLAGTSQNLIGGTQTTADVLVIDAQGGCVVSSAPGTLTIAGSQPITSEFEQVNVTGQCLVEVPTLGPLAMAALAAFLALAAIFVMRPQISG